MYSLKLTARQWNETLLLLVILVAIFGKVSGGCAARMEKISGPHSGRTCYNCLTSGRSWFPGAGKGQKTCQKAWRSGQIDTKMMKKILTSVSRGRDVLKYFPDTKANRIATLCFNKRKVDNILQEDEAISPLDVHLRAGNAEYVFLLLEKNALNVLDHMTRSERLVKIKEMQALAVKGDRGKTPEMASVETIYLDFLFKKRVFGNTKLTKPNITWWNRRRALGIDFYTIHKYLKREEKEHDPVPSNEGQACKSDVDCVLEDIEADQNSLPVCCLDGGNPFSPRGKCKNTSQCVVSVSRARAVFGGQRPIDMLLNRPGARPQITEFDPRQNIETKDSRALQPLDQGKCGTCWAHAASTSISYNLFIRTKGIANFVVSAQDIGQRTLFPDYHELTKKPGKFSKKPEFLASLAKREIAKSQGVLRFEDTEMMHFFKAGEQGTHNYDYFKTLSTGNGLFPRICRPYRCRVASKQAKEHWIQASLRFLQALSGSKIRRKRQELARAQRTLLPIVVPKPSKSAEKDEKEVKVPLTDEEVAERKKKALGNWKKVAEAFTTTPESRASLELHAELKSGIMSATAYIGLPKDLPELEKICRKQIPRIKLDKGKPYVPIGQLRRPHSGAKGSCFGGGDGCGKKVGNNIFNNPRLPFGGFEDGPLDNFPKFENRIMDVLKEQGSISIRMFADFDNRDSYGYVDGVFIPKTVYISINHEVSLVGWGVTTSGIPYWLFINSWGKSWNGDGYFKVQRGISITCQDEYIERWEHTDSSEDATDDLSTEDTEDYSTSNSLSPAKDNPPVQKIEKVAGGSSCGLDFFMAHATKGLQDINNFGVYPVIRGDTISAIIRQHRKCKEKICLHGILHTDCGCLCEKGWISSEDPSEAQKTGCNICSLQSCPSGETLNRDQCVCECAAGRFGFGCSLSAIVAVGKYQCYGDDAPKYILFLQLLKDEDAYSQAIADGDDEEKGDLLASDNPEHDDEVPGRNGVEAVENDIEARLIYKPTGSEEIVGGLSKYTFPALKTYYMYRLEKLQHSGMKAAEVVVNVPLGLNELGQNKGTVKAAPTYLNNGKRQFSKAMVRRCGGKQATKFAGFVPSISTHERAESPPGPPEDSEPESDKAVVGSQFTDRSEFSV